VSVVKEQTVPATRFPPIHSRTTVAGPAPEFRTVPARSIPAGFRVAAFVRRVISKAFRPSEPWM